MCHRFWLGEASCLVSVVKPAGTGPGAQGTLCQLELHPWEGQRCSTFDLVGICQAEKGDLTITSPLTSEPFYKT